MPYLLLSQDLEYPMARLVIHGHVVRVAGAVYQVVILPA